MKVLKNGKCVKKVIVCECECEFEYQPLDIKSKISNGLIYTSSPAQADIDYYVVCPECNKKHILETKREFI